MVDERQDRAEITFFRIFKIEHLPATSGRWGGRAEEFTRLRLIADAKEGPRGWADIELPGTDYEFVVGRRYTLTLTPE